MTKTPMAKTPMATMPMIGIVGRRIGVGGVRGWKQSGAVAVPAPYLDAVQRAGAMDAVTYPSERVHLEEWVERVDGLLLLGGPDVDPARYGAEPHAKTYGVDPLQDAAELAAVHLARTCDLPLLAICRGMQVLNVACGGTLVQHLPDHPRLGHHTVPDASEAGGRHPHPVEVAAGTRVAKAMGVLEAMCPSSHHQAVDALGAGLRAVGWSSDGLVEAVEHDDGWVVGVQWHPESTAAVEPAQQGLFDAFVEQCRARSAAHSAARRSVSGLPSWGRWITHRTANDSRKGRLRAP